ncbi:S1 family peptidase [Hydrogenophaga atypica]|uniref:Serine protease n=1 Tax=Hydrogenophaga atypica TaxID=249409 RepID=A0ABW2QGU1_9BURK
MSKKEILLFLGCFLVYGQAFGQDIIYRCGNDFTNDIKGREKECRLVYDPNAEKSSKNNLPPARKKLSSTGSGFAVASKGFVTNHHVISACEKIEIDIGGDSFSAQVKAHSQAEDVAFLELDRAHKIETRVSNRINPGQEIYAVGFPLRGLLADLIITKGVINSLSGLGGDINKFQISAQLQQGNSGGPILNEYGEVVGVAVSKLDVIRYARIAGDIPQNVNFAIKASVLNELDRLPVSSANPDWLRFKKSGEEIAKIGKSIAGLVKCYDSK